MVIPVFNERDNLEPLYEQLNQSLDALGYSYEIVFVNDGSRDGSTRVLEQLAARDSRVRLLEFVRNFGQTAALAAGFEHAQGQMIISLDADLQNDPGTFPMWRRS